MRFLVLNAGSSSIKCWLGEFPADAPTPLWQHQVDLGRDSPSALLEPVLRELPSAVEAVGHRIVHAGAKYRDTVSLTGDVRKAIAEEADVAPAHNRIAIAGIETVDRVLGGIPQLAVFDTSFHKTLEPAAYVYPGPYQWIEQGIRRYGFHGISYQYAARRASELLGAENTRRLIVCHLGNGASVAAIRNGKSVDTSMGFTPLEGLMMGTRCGSIDPGILIYLERHHGYKTEDLDRILNRESGLLGVSGRSADMREILSAMREGDERAQLAFDMYVHSLTRMVGAMAAVLSGADALVFTGGVGEHSPEVRDAVVRQTSFLGAKVLVIHAEEEWEIARECYRVITRSVTRE
jgi:acetate kinase